MLNSKFKIQRIGWVLGRSAMRSTERSTELTPKSHAEVSVEPFRASTQPTQYDKRLITIKD